MSRLHPPQLPLRLRLTLWYTLSLGLILLLFTTFLTIQVRRSLIAQVDSGLYQAANQALLAVQPANGQLLFQESAQNPNAIRNLSDDFAILLLAQDETVAGTLSSDDQIPIFSEQPAGFKTRLEEGEPWRVYRQAIEIGSISGWIQVAQELDPVMTTLASLQTQIYWGLLFALLLSGLGGYFMASRALRPIDQITRTAQAITANDLTKRIHYQGPQDELGRLSQTLDAMLDRLQAAFARERRFTGDAAHELRTPLTALKGRIGVTLSRTRQPDVYRATLQEMEGQVDRLIQLSNDLLFMARLDQEQFRPQLQRIELADFMEAVLDQIRPLADEKAIVLVENIPDRLLLYGDLELLIRLFLNLLDNAVKYTPKNGRITLQAEETVGGVQISLTDTGPGIAAEHLPHLFERFYRVEDDRARQWPAKEQGGAGLGLAIAQEIVRFHGGVLSIASKIGQGTTFLIQLPANDQSAGNRHD